MVTHANGNYIRYFLLLVQCGTEILRFLLKKALRLEGKTLDTLLQNAAIEAQIRASKPSQRDLELLYPPPTKVRDTSKWDITLLFFIINKFLTSKLKAIEKNACAKIKDYRNEISHYPDCAMDDHTFQKHWNSVSFMINTICNDMKPIDSQRIKETIERIETQSNLQRGLFELEHLLHDRFDNLQENIRSLEQSLQQSQAQLTAAIETGQTDTQQCITDAKDVLIKEIRELVSRPTHANLANIELIVKGILRALADDKDTKQCAEEYLVRATATSVQHKVPDDDIKDLKEKVDDLVESIGKCGGTLTDYNKGSVILDFNCPSVDVVLNLVNLFYGPVMTKHLNEISEALKALLGKKVQLEAYLLRQPIQVIKQKLRDLEQQRTVELIISCNGVEGLKKIWDIFEEGGAANTFNELSVALSKAVGKHISIETSIDVDNWKNALQEANAQLDFLQFVSTCEKLTEQPKPKEWYANVEMPEDGEEVKTLMTIGGVENTAVNANRIDEDISKGSDVEQILDDGMSKGPDVEQRLDYDVSKGPDVEQRLDYDVSKGPDVEQRLDYDVSKGSDVELIKKVPWWKQPFRSFNRLSTDSRDSARHHNLIHQFRAFKGETIELLPWPARTGTFIRLGMRETCLVGNFLSPCAAGHFCRTFCCLTKGVEQNSTFKDQSAHLQHDVRL